MKHFFILIFCIFLVSCSNKSKRFELVPISSTAKSFDNLLYTGASSDLKTQSAKKELLTIAHKINLNETGGDRNNLVYWNPNESFPSLGIGHFIWYPEGYHASYGDMLPSLIAFYKLNNRKVPPLLNSRYAPWSNKAELEKARQRGELEEVIQFFENTKDVQIVFIYNRLIASVDKMIQSSDNPRQIQTQFNRVLQTKNGLYPLIDYVNFKGEGTQPIKEYNNISWGLMQVLEGMSGSQPGKKALSDFASSCKSVLENRVKNQPRGKNDGVFLAGWKKRCDTYANALYL
ncbi:hypothetical protein [Thorsellia kenyensis]|uniref:Lipoprotein n=1 Tax=Thorsellia kenyensis TaxID=1549888 RepID=A0ABV6CCE1_9GAMM